MILFKDNAHQVYSKDNSLDFIFDLLKFSVNYFFYFHNLTSQKEIY